MEKWKDVEGYEGYYKISNYGRLKNSKNLIIALQDLNGYKRYCLSKNGKRKSYYIHRLVAKHFLENPQNLLEVNHKDEDKSNNKFQNLEWCNRKYNMNYGNRGLKARETYLEGIKSGRIDTSKISERQCKKVLNITTGEQYKSLKEAILITGILKISNCCTGKRKTAGGMKWKYLED